MTCTQNSKLPGGLSVTPKTFGWRQNEAREKSEQRDNEPVNEDSVSDGVQKKSPYKIDIISLSGSI